MLGTRYGPVGTRFLSSRDQIFSDCRDPVTTFADSRDPICNSRDTNRVPKTPLKTCLYVYEPGSEAMVFLPFYARKYTKHNEGLAGRQMIKVLAQPTITRNHFGQIKEAI